MVHRVRLGPIQQIGQIRRFEAAQLTREANLRNLMAAEPSVANDGPPDLWQGNPYIDLRCRPLRANLLTWPALGRRFIRL